MKTRIPFLIAFSAISVLLTASLASAADLVSIDVVPVSASIPAGTTEQFQAFGNFSDNTVQNLTATVVWSSSNPIAVVSNIAGSQGLATGLSTGQATITAGLGTISGSTNLTVTPAVLASIEVDPVNASIPAGTTEQFQALGHFTDSSVANLTATVVWSSSNPSIAVVSNIAGSQGLATGLSTGQVTITATFGQISGSTNLTVTASYSIVAFQQPINDPINPMSVFKLNSTVPVKFQLTNQNGNLLDDSDASAIAANCQVTIGLTYLSSATGPVDETVNSTTANMGNCFRYDSTSHSFIFNLGTKGLSTGTYTITATVTGSFATTHSVNVGLR